MICGKEQIGPRVTAVDVLDGYKLKLEFDNGEQRMFDAQPLLEMPAFQDLPRVFNKAEVQFGTVVWPGDIDISPDTLYARSIVIE